MIRSLFKRSSVYFSGLALGRLLSTIVFILFARTLLPEKFGSFIFFITLLQVVTFFSDFGLNQWYQKRINHEEKNQLLGTVLKTRFYTLLISFIASIFILKTTSFSSVDSILFLLLLIPEALLSIVDGYYLEKKQSLRVAIKTVSKMAILLIGYFVFVKTFSFDLAVRLYLFSSIITALWYFPWEKVSSALTVRLKRVFSAIFLSRHYAFLIFTSFAYSRGDSLVIQYNLNSAALGLYGSAYRYLESLSLVPTALIHNLFPISAKKEGVTFVQLLRITFIMGVLGFLVATLMYFWSNLLIVGLLGNAYISGISLLHIFSFVLILFFINAPLNTVVQSSSLVNKFVPLGVANTILNIALNLIFIPRYGIVTAAWVMLITEFSGLLIHIYFIRKLYS